MSNDACIDQQGFSFLYAKKITSVKERLTSVDSGNWNLYNILYAAVNSCFIGFDWSEEVFSRHLVKSTSEEKLRLERNRIFSIGTGNNNLENMGISKIFGPVSGIVCGGKEFVFFIDLVNLGQEEPVCSQIEAESFAGLPSMQPFF